MNVGALSTLGMSLQARKSAADVQRELMALQQEQATGKRRDVAEHLGALTSRDIMLRETFSQADSFITSNKTIASRIEITQAAMTGARENANAFISNIVAALNGDVAANLIPDAAADLIGNLEGALNTSFGGRLLFSGTNVDQQSIQISNQVNGGTGVSPDQVLQNVIAAKAPVTDAATLNDLLTGPDGISSIFDDTHTNANFRFNTTFYNGNAQDVTARIDAETTVLAGARADDPGVKLIMEAAYTLAALDPDTMPSGQYRTLLEGALDKVQRGIGQMEQTQAILGLSEQAIERAQERHDLTLNVATKQVNEMEGADPYETSVRLSNAISQIEATFSITARISRLSLMNYL
ncbi:flagellin [Tepidicaulis sp. LMO-SS28]|uniref:flagellin N-terminal helical domain-containing protein n=1 Tax=Tepidicaulis sp. LMO-SS28 TaxID=3447455 RepID=UPI003EDED47A